MKWPSWAHLRPDPEATENQLRGCTTCDQCNAIIPLTDEASARMEQPAALVVAKHTSEYDLIFHFCNEQCANIHLLERLRNTGL